MERYNLVSIPPFEKNIPKEVYNRLEDIVWENLLKEANPDEFFAPYIFPFENLQKIADSDNVEYKESLRQMADDVWSQNLWLSALIIYFILLHITNFLPTDFYKFAYLLAKLGNANEAIALVEIYESQSTNIKTTYHALANFYYSAVDIPQKAIEYFEKLLEIDSTNALAYNSVGHLYSQLDIPNVLEKQLYYFEKAYNLEPNNPNFLKSFLTVHEKLHNTEMIKLLYPKLIELADTPRHSLNYGLYEFSWGNIQKGAPYFAQRFELENYPIGYPKNILGLKNKWNYKDDISDKTLLIHFEEGYGDTIMYSRFLPIIKQYAKETVFVMQKGLLELFKNSPIISDGIILFDNLNETLEYLSTKQFMHMPLLDAPYPLGIDTCFIPYPDKYLTEITPKQFDRSKFNIGIAYNGDVTANYNGRDIQLKEFFNLSQIQGVQLYSLQVGESAKQLKSLPKEINIIDLGKTFTNFSDTANALSGLDLVITTDNVILNLAGALGVETLGLFNKYPNYRWFNLSGNDVVWYKSVRPLQCNVENNWKDVLAHAESIVKEKIKALNF